MAIQVKRIYDPPEAGDGVRVLVDRIWPRGVSKQAAAVESWLKEVAPSTELRQWFGHDPARWKEFLARYRKELAGQPEAVDYLRGLSASGVVTLVYSARDTEHNNAVALALFLGNKR